MSEDEKQAQESIDAALATIEVTASLADVAKAMRDALEARGFGTPVSENAAIQFMFVAASMRATSTEGKTS